MARGCEGRPEDELTQYRTRLACGNGHKGTCTLGDMMIQGGGWLKAVTDYGGGSDQVPVQWRIRSVFFFRGGS